MRKGFAFLLAIVLCISFSTTAFAEPPDTSTSLSTIQTIEKNKDLIKKIKGSDDFKVVYDDGKGNWSFTVAERTQKSKDQVLSTIDQFSVQDTTHTMSGSKKIDYSNGYVRCSFSDSCQQRIYFEHTEVDIDGNSSSFWSGSDPFYASSIDQSDKFGCSYIGASVDITYPPGVGFSGSGSSCTLTYPQLVGDYYSYYHSYGTVNFNAFWLTKITRSNAATYRFGTYTVSPVCSSTWTLPLS